MVFMSGMFPVNGYCDNEQIHEAVNKLKANGIVEKTQDTGKEMAKGLENYKPDPAMLELAREAAKRTETEEFKKEFGQYQESIQKSIKQYVPAAKESIKPEGRKEEEGGVLLKPDERIYILMSSSVPDGTVRRYLRDISDIGDPNVIMVFRGVPGGMENFILFQNTIVEQWGGKDLKFLNMQIDPHIFRMYSINAVPAFIYVNGLELVDIEQSEGWSDNAKVKDACIVRGDVSLDYAVESIYQKTGNSRVLGILQKLRRSFYGN